MRGVMYGADIIPTIGVQEGGRRLEASLNRSSKDVRGITLAVGECAEFTLTLRNAGRGDIDDIWIVHSPFARIELDERSKKSCFSSALMHSRLLLFLFSFHFPV